MHVFKFHQLHQVPTNCHLHSLLGVSSSHSGRLRSIKHVHSSHLVGGGLDLPSCHCFPITHCHSPSVPASPPLLPFLAPKPSYLFSPTLPRRASTTVPRQAVHTNTANLLPQESIQTFKVINALCALPGFLPILSKFLIRRHKLCGGWNLRTTVLSETDSHHSCVSVFWTGSPGEYPPIETSKLTGLELREESIIVASKKAAKRRNSSFLPKAF